MSLSHVRPTRPPASPVALLSGTVTKGRLDTMRIPSHAAPPDTASTHLLSAECGSVRRPPRAPLHEYHIRGTFGGGGTAIYEGVAVEPLGGHLCAVWAVPEARVK